MVAGPDSENGAGSLNLTQELELAPRTPGGDESDDGLDNQWAVEMGVEGDTVDWEESPTLAGNDIFDVEEKDSPQMEREAAAADIPAEDRRDFPWF